MILYSEGRVGRSILLCTPRRRVEGLYHCVLLGEGLKVYMIVYSEGRVKV